MTDNQQATIDNLKERLLQANSDATKWEVRYQLLRLKADEVVRDTNGHRFDGALVNMAEHLSEPWDPDNFVFYDEPTHKRLAAESYNNGYSHGIQEAHNAIDRCAAEPIPTVTEVTWSAGEEMVEVESLEGVDVEVTFWPPTPTPCPFDESSERGMAGVWKAGYATAIADAANEARR